jgi:hypothetical protein
VFAVIPASRFINLPVNGSDSIEGDCIATVQDGLLRLLRFNPHLVRWENALPQNKPFIRLGKMIGVRKNTPGKNIVVTNDGRGLITSICNNQISHYILSFFHAFIHF